MNRKFLIAGGLAGALVVGSGASVVIADFCADDPMIQVAPGRVVYLTDYADSTHIASLKSVKYRVLRTYHDDDKLHVTMIFFVPSEPSGEAFDIQYVISTGPDGSGTVLASGESESGKVVIVNFILAD